MEHNRAISTRRYLPPKRRRDPSWKRIARAGLYGLARFFDENVQGLLFTGLVFILGVLLGVGLMKSAGASGEVHEVFLDSLDGLSIPPNPDKLPPGEELLTADPQALLIPVRDARAGRVLSFHRDKPLRFGGRFLDFPEWYVDRVPSLRRFDFDSATWRAEQ